MSCPLIVQIGGESHVFTESFTAGRKGDLVIADEYASPVHTRFFVSDGHWFLADQGSTNGTWVNGHKVWEDVIVKGDKVRIGHTVLTVVPA